MIHLKAPEEEGYAESCKAYEKEVNEKADKISKPAKKKKK